MQPGREVPEEGVADLTAAVVLSHGSWKAARREVRLPREVELVDEQLESLDASSRLGLLKCPWRDGGREWYVRPVALSTSRNDMGWSSRERVVEAVPARPANRSRSTSAPSSQDDPVHTTVSSPKAVLSRRYLTCSSNP